MNPPIREIPQSKLEVWEDANVRKTQADANIEELAQNIKRNGIENPLLVKENAGRYKIFAGQRRFLAACIINLDHLPCRVFKNISLDDAISLSLSENIFSKQMTTLDKADAVKHLVTTHRDRKKVCKILGIKPATLQYYLAYHGLPNEIMDLVDSKVINMQFAVNVFRKFSKTNATEILREVSRTKKATIQRKLILSAISRADKTDSIHDIKADIRRSDAAITVRINLEQHELKVLQKLASQNKLSADQMISTLLKKIIGRTKLG